MRSRIYPVDPAESRKRSCIAGEASKSALRLKKFNISLICVLKEFRKVSIGSHFRSQAKQARLVSVNEVPVSKNKSDTKKLMMVCMYVLQHLLSPKHGLCRVDMHCAEVEPLTYEQTDRDRAAAHVDFRTSSRRFGIQVVSSRKNCAS